MGYEMSECVARHGQPHCWMKFREGRQCGACGATEHPTPGKEVNVSGLTPGQARVLEAVAAAGPQGLTLAEYAAGVSRFPNEVSGRFTELRGRGRIRRLPAKRGNPSGYIWVTT